MAELKATPGPWAICHDLQSGDFMICYANDEGLGPSLLEGGLVLADDNENEANAHLIAAAPALYEALVDCHMRLQTARDIGNAADDAALAKGLGALKQARGEQ